MNFPVRAFSLAVILATASVAEPSRGGSFALTAAVTSGGGRAAGPGFALEGSAGQPSVQTSTGGNYQLSGGLLGVIIVPGDVLLTIEHLDTGEAKLTWPASATGYVLEFAAQLTEPAGWQPVVPAPVGNNFQTPLNQPLRFYRLHRR
ncbi:MAG: hypothetical protein J0M24_26500 [Verrucomicrobia bacterium]|nr:hypothetical protein [Verrucomicrobiota bacterium]